MARIENRNFQVGRKRRVLNSTIRLVAFSIAALMTCETISVANAQQAPAPVQPQGSSQTSQSQSTNQAGTVPAENGQDARKEPTDSLPSAPVPQSAAQAPPQQQERPQQPVGTAAAPYEKPTGVPGSRPAGAVIAPAKQRRVRAIIIRVGIVLAAGAAVGTVVGLSKATHSTPQ